MEPPYKKIKLDLDGNDCDFDRQREREKARDREKARELWVIQNTMNNDNMKPIDELRNEFVDYSDLTTNEPRYTKNNTIDGPPFYYPLGNIYPYGKLPILHYEDKLIDRDYFYITLRNNQIQYAIQYLQINALKKYLTRNFKNHLFNNPFHYLFRTFYPIDKNLEATIEIIKILIQNYDDYPDLIKELYCPLESNQRYILDLLYTFTHE